MTTRLMGRITAYKTCLPGLTAELRAAGYALDIMPDELVEDPDDREEFAFIEAYREIPPQEATQGKASLVMLKELGDIAARHGTSDRSRPAYQLEQQSP